MKYTTVVIFVFFVLGCNNSQTDWNSEVPNVKTDTVYVHDTIIKLSNQRFWQENFELTHDPDKDSIWLKPVSYYLADEKCSGLALAFYYGRLEPLDDEVTDKLLELAITDNSKLRPFYRWCLDQTIMIQDGALAEHTGIPARKYAEKYPKEFFEYMDSDKSGLRYRSWVGSIEYSGFYDMDHFDKPDELQSSLIKVMKSNCRECDEKIISRINDFAKACFN
jgi:hypothetical protein